MKKKFFVFFLCLTALSTLSQARAEKPEFEYSVGAEVVSHYIWRGQNLGGLSVQPCVEIGGAGVTLGAWASLGASDNLFNADSYFYPELDVYLSYSIAGFTVSATHYHYFDSKFFNFKNGADNWNQTEVMLSYTVSDEIPLSISWNTMVGGRDNKYDYVDANGNEYVDTDGSGEIEDAEILDWKRAYSTYIELAYDFSLPWELNLHCAVGMSPWKSFYSGYEKDFIVNNITVRAEREFEVSDYCSLSAFVQPMYDPSNNAFIGALGVGVWF